MDDFFTDLTPAAFHALLEQDLGQVDRLDHFTSTAHEQKTGRAALATSPELLVHITAGNLPNPTLTSIILGVLTRSAQWVKCACGAAFLPRLFAHSLYHSDPKLGACLEVAGWRGGNEELERILFEEAACVTATGTDETLAEIRRRIPTGTRFLAYGFRLSFGYVAHEVLSGLHARKVVERAATDVVAWNQLGCLSPHVIYVQEGVCVFRRNNLPRRWRKFWRDANLSEPRGELPVEASPRRSPRAGPCMNCAPPIRPTRGTVVQPRFHGLDGGL